MSVNVANFSIGDSAGRGRTHLSVTDLTALRSRLCKELLQLNNKAQLSKGLRVVLSSNRNKSEH